MAIGLKRVYEQPTPSDGFRVLVERLWPRGISKDKARIDLWARDAAPSTELRRWFNHDPAKWDEFKRRYYIELNQHSAILDELRRRAGKGAGAVTFVFASREERCNNAVALKEYLEDYE